MEGKLFGPYRTLRVLGEGGMGTVLLAEHVHLGQRVAIKVLHGAFTRNTEVIARFVQEARASARIGNEHIVRVLDFGYADDGTPYLVMEYLEGQSLAQALAAGGLEDRRVLHILGQLCEALRAAHSAGIVHRDLKPENVFLTRRRDDADYVKVLDFGVSKVIEAEGEGRGMTRTGMMVGTPQYMAPEQAHGARDVDARADIYALGVIAFEMLTGNPPFDAPSVPAVLVKVASEPPPNLGALRGDLPPGLVRLVMDALAKERSQRPADCETFRARLLAPTMWEAAASVSRAPSPVAHGSLADLQRAMHVPTKAHASDLGTGPWGFTLFLIAVLCLGAWAASTHSRQTSAAITPAHTSSTALPARAVVPSVPVPRVQPARTTGAPSAMVPRAASANVEGRTLDEEPQVRALVDRWSALVIDGHGAGDAWDVYASRVRFRTMGPRLAPDEIASFWARSFAAGATVTLDRTRSRVQTERDGEEPSARATCTGPRDAPGPLYKIRLWVEEHTAQRASAVGCSTLQGVYILRSRDMGGELRVCHETWSLREGVCASCPSAPACQRPNGLRVRAARPEADGDPERDRSEPNEQ